MEQPRPEFVPRPPRVDFPVLVSFASDTFTVRQFSLNLSEGGMFLPTDKTCEIGTEGTIKFRSSQYDRPMSVRAKVVRTVVPGSETNGQQAGLGIQFQNLTEKDLERLRAIVEGVSSGTVVERIRRSILESNQTMEVELRQRPTDQKMMLALTATSPEIDALIRDGTPSVLIRLLDCPRLSTPHVAAILRSPRVPTRVLSAIKLRGKWLSGAENRYLFCVHVNANPSEAIGQMKMLPPEHLRRIAANGQVKPALRVKATELSRKKGPLFRR